MTERRVGNGDNTEGSRDGDGRTDGRTGASVLATCIWSGRVAYGMVDR